MQAETTARRIATGAWEFTGLVAIFAMGIAYWVISP